MDDDRFWSIWEKTLAARGNQERQLALLTRELSSLSADELAAFQAAFDRQMNRAYTWDLWGAAYVVEGGASDDSFDYFRWWLIAQGRQGFENALKDPESISDLIPTKRPTAPEFEELGSVVTDAWSAKTGRPSGEMPPGPRAPGEPSGEPFEEDDRDLARRYPRLWKRFGQHPLN